MANIMIPPTVLQVASNAGVDRKAQLPAGQDGSFIQHLERKMVDKKAEGNKLLSASSKSKTTQQKNDGSSEPPASIEALLQQLMIELKDAAEKPGTEAGEWTFQLQDMGLLEKLAGQAGMDAGTLALLKKQMKEEGGLPLADLFAALEKNFKELGAVKKVTVAETYLPLLETFLSKLGITPEAIQQLDRQAVDGVGQLDLAAFLKGLQDTLGKGQDGAPSSITLTDWEQEQLASMLAEAGVPSEKIEAMFPEQASLQQKALGGLSPDEGNAPVEMSLDRLASILQQALAAVDEARPKPELPGFLKELHTVLSQTGFQSNDVGWSPVVQGAMKDVYAEVQKMITQGQGREEKAMEIKSMNDAIDDDWQLSGTDQIPETSALEQDGDMLNGEAANGNGSDATDLTSDNNKGVGGIEMKAASPIQTEAGVKMQPPRMHFASDLQQFTVDQISQGVLRGLKNNDHHLILTLYPKELGEVKVDLQVRGSQLSATFVMENQKVKEAMESNMGEFKDNLERRGFSLESMSVSVGQQDKGNDNGQRFVAAWEQIVANQNRETVAVPGVNAMGFGSNDQATLRQGSISLFV